MRYTFMIAALVTCLLGCNNEPSLSEQLGGKWLMQTVSINGENRAGQLNPTGDRWIDFQANGTFNSGSGDSRENGGTYTLDETSGRLELDSDAGPGDDSNWHISFSKDSMYMRGIGTDRQENSLVAFTRQ